ncbi:MAG: site-specific DNA-methyltransferase [Nanoarchaeota archaeon]
MPILTDNEIRDISKYLQSGKPLPDKYRFLLFGEKREVELVWNGKTDEVCNIVMPFQTIEQVDEPRVETDTKMQKSIFDFGVDNRGRQLSGWTNKLIWGDNKLILSSLKNGSLRQEIEKQGGIKLIYIDPPFDVGADFSMKIEVGENNEEFTKEANILEEVAYRDTWGRGADSFIAMLYERLSIMKDLLADDGCIYVHCDWRVNSYIRLILDEIFGKECYRNEISWRCSSGARGVAGGQNQYIKTSNSILFYSKIPKGNKFKIPFREYSEATLKMYKYDDKDGRGRYRLQMLRNYSQKSIEEMRRDNRIYEDENGTLQLKQYHSDKEGVAVDDIWTDVHTVQKTASENTNYPTQKSESLLNRIIEASSENGDLVADFFCGSGTTLAVAEKLGRKWIGSDLGKFAIHTTRKRMIDVQRQLKSSKQSYRAFEILNLGKYERQHYIGVNPNLRDEEKQKQLAQKEQDFIKLILNAYRAESVDNFKTFHGKKNNRLVAIGPINHPVTRLFVEEIILECREKHITKVDILGFEYEMGLVPHIQEEAKTKGIDLAFKQIPREVFDKRAVEKNQVVFYDVSYIEIKPHYKGNSVAVELTDFSVFYTQDSIKNAEESLKDGGHKIVVENGQMIKILKDKSGIITNEILTKKWTDWIDYWSVDFDFESKKEIVRKPKDLDIKQNGKLNPEKYKIEYEEAWVGDYIFENEWQSFRTKKNRDLELKSVFKECKLGRRKIAVKVVDIFGNDTMKIIDVDIRGN